MKPSPMCLTYFTFHFIIHFYSFPDRILDSITIIICNFKILDLQI
nr:MAG TPA: hypothetical protein [Caudoviricetes sp.]